MAITRQEGSLAPQPRPASKVAARAPGQIGGAPVGPSALLSPAQVLAWQRLAGNQAVSRTIRPGPPAKPAAQRQPPRPPPLQRVLQIDHVDYNPDTGAYTDWRVTAADLKHNLAPYLVAGGGAQEIPADNTPLPVPKRTIPRNALAAVTDHTPNLNAPDVPSLAAAVATHLQGTQGLTNFERTRLVAASEDSIARASYALPPGKGDAFDGLITHAASTSRSKGTANEIALGQLPGAMQGGVQGIAGALQTRNQAMIASGLQLGRFPLIAGLADKASVDFASVRTAHTNLSGWLPAHMGAPMQPFATLEANVLNNTVGAFHTALQDGDDLNEGYRRRVEALLVAALGGAPSNRQRMVLHWCAYAMQQPAALPYAYIEFAGPSTYVSRFLYDYTSGDFYLSVHYSWSKGYNPFFKVTGLAEW